MFFFFFKYLIFLRNKLRLFLKVLFEFVRLSSKIKYDFEFFSVK